MSRSPPWTLSGPSTRPQKVQGCATNISWTNCRQSERDAPTSISRMLTPHERSSTTTWPGRTRGGDSSTGRAGRGGPIHPTKRSHIVGASFSTRTRTFGRGGRPWRRAGIESRGQRAERMGTDTPAGCVAFNKSYSTYNSFTLVYMYSCILFVPYGLQCDLFSSQPPPPKPALPFPQPNAPHFPLLTSFAAKESSVRNDVAKSNIRVS